MSNYNNEKSIEEASKKNREFWANLFGIKIDENAPPLSGKDLAGLFDHLLLPGEKIDAVEEVRKIRGGFPNSLSYGPCPVTALERGMVIDLKSMKKGKFYRIEYLGEKYAVRMTKKNILETYKIKQ